MTAKYQQIALNDIFSDGKKVKKGSDDQGTSKKGIFTNRANV